MTRYQPSPWPVVIAGDIVTDVNIYTGERMTPKMSGRRGIARAETAGGAVMLATLLDTVWETDVRLFAWRSANPSRKLPGGEYHPRHFRTHLIKAPPTGEGYAIWSPSAANSSEDAKKRAHRGEGTVWRVKEPMGYASQPTIAELAAYVPQTPFLILDDAGFSFRRLPAQQLRQITDQVVDNGCIFLKMAERSGPADPENLWRHLFGPDGDGDGAAKDKTVIGLISARDLRREPLGLDRGLSWEATLDDLRIALSEGGRAHRLLHHCTHLIVTLSADGAVWVRQDGTCADGSPRFNAWACVDTTSAEGEWGATIPGDVFGYHAAMAAALAEQIIRAIDTGTLDALDLKPAINAGVKAMRQLRRIGHGPVDNTNTSPGYPYSQIARFILDERDRPAALAPNPTQREQIHGFDLTWDRCETRPNAAWSLTVDRETPRMLPHETPLLHLARQVVRYGPDALLHVPHARFGKFITADRPVMETLRHIKRLMLGYRATEKPERPLSIGVFGPPGAGKSFGVNQIAEEIFGEHAWQAYNLSQFSDSKELNGALHQVRDAALSGITPVVFWDEFDSRELDWLRYLLAPMQDGKFQHGDLRHTIGKCVFVFAGGTSSSYGEFKGQGESPSGIVSDRVRRFVLAKGPDFVSRLDAHLDVLGPNQRLIRHKRGGFVPDQSDHGAPIRRALMIRHHLKCAADDRVDFDSGLLQALLTIGRYEHGARWLEKLMEVIRPSGPGADPTVIRRSTVPLPAQLGMHVNAAEFDRIVNDWPATPDVPFSWDEIEAMAERFHHEWHNRTKSRGQTPPAIDGTIRISVCEAR